MTSPTSDDPFPPQHEAVQEQPPAFDDQLLFDLTKQVELTQLAEEIGSAVGRQVSVAQMGPDHGFVPAPDNPAHLAVSPGNLSKTKIQKALDDHEPIIGYDVPEREKAYGALQDRLMNEPDSELSDEDMRVAVRGLVLRDAGRQPGPL